MFKMSELVGRELKWEQPSGAKQFYELLFDGSALGTLHMESSFNSRAEASNAEGSWHFDRKGFWQRESFIYSANGDMLAHYKANTWRQGGLLELASGRRYVVKFNFWMTQFFLTTEDDQALISLSKIGGVFHYSGYVEIHSLAKNLPELPWLVPFAWYLVLLQFRDTAAAAAAA